MIKQYIKKVYKLVKKVDIDYSSEIKTISLIRFYWPYLLMRLRSYLFLRTVGYIGPSVILKNRSNIDLSTHFKMGEGVEICGLSSKQNRIGKSFSIGRFSKIRSTALPSSLGTGFFIGDYVGMGDFCYLGCFGGVTIGDETIIGERLLIHSDIHDFSDINENIRDLECIKRPVNIGKRCWIGSNVIILGGTTIGNDCVIGAGSVVTKSFPSGSVIAGNPASLIKSRKI